jgi:murein endopeptidase
MFTIEQFWSLVRTLLQSAGAAMVARGWIDGGSAEIVVGLAMNILTTAYSLWLRRKAGLVATAAALPEVAKIVTTPEIAAKVDDRTTVVTR